MSVDEKRREALMKRLEVAKARHKVELASKKPGIVLQIVSPRDQFEFCTLTVEQWLAAVHDSSSEWGDSVFRARIFIAACAAVDRGIEGLSGLRQQPAVGYDPVGDQPIFIFKMSHAGVTFLVSPYGIAGFSEYELMEMGPDGSVS